MGFGLGVVVGFGDRFRGSGGAVILGEVAAMQEEVWEDAVKEAAAVAVAFLAVAEQPEVLRRPWRHVRPQLNHDAAWVVKSVSRRLWPRLMAGVPSDPERLICSFRVGRAATSRESLRQAGQGVTFNTLGGPAAGCLP